MIDWGAVLFWQITDTDTAGCLSEEMGEWYMSVLAQNQAKNAHILQGDIGTLETICVSAFIVQRGTRIQRPLFCLLIAALPSWASYFLIKG